MNTPTNLLILEAGIFDALAHPARLEILEVLQGGEACVCHIQAMSNQRQSYISQQLNVLRQAGIVTSRKDGQWIYYQVSEPNLYDVIDQIKEILQNLGRWQPEFSSDPDMESKRKMCNCPQCSLQTNDQPCIPSTVSRA
jgi:DNA-binding transcriptional ArsR family regulator